MVWSCIIVVAMTLGLFFFQYTIRKMNQRLYQKNRQFEVLSNTVDETFLIFEKDKNQCDFVSGSADKVLGLSADLLKENRALIYSCMSEETAEEIRRKLYTESKISWDTMIEDAAIRNTCSRAGCSYSSTRSRKTERPNAF